MNPSLDPPLRLRAEAEHGVMQCSNSSIWKALDHEHLLVGDRRRRACVHISGA